MFSEDRPPVGVKPSGLRLRALEIDLHVNQGVNERFRFALEVKPEVESPNIKGRLIS